MSKRAKVQLITYAAAMAMVLVCAVRADCGMARFTIVEESRDLIRVVPITGADFEESATGQIREGLARRLAEGVTIDVQRVAEIPREASGKYCYIASKVAP